MTPLREATSDFEAKFIVEMPPCQVFSLALSIVHYGSNFWAVP